MATIKITVHEARNLPVMDRASGLADPYVFVRFDDMQHQTHTEHETLNPQWNSDARFDIPELQSLQEDPLEVRVYDYDKFSRDDIIGSVFIDWNCLLEDPSARPTLSQWFPIYDTMSGLRGELKLTLKVIFHGGDNPFAPKLATRGRVGLRQIAAPSSSEGGIFIFSMARLDPSVYRVESLHAMAEELLVKADPEQSTLTSLRSSRSTYEARMVQLFKLSGKVRKLLSKKVLELGCNCVLGYRETFDFENVNGIIVRAYGTPCVVSAVDPELIMMGAHQLPEGEGGEDHHHHHDRDAPAAKADQLARQGRSRALLDITKLTRSQVDVLTLTQLPTGVLQMMGGTVCARSVKVVSRHRAKASMVQERDTWWMELREEMKANARSYGCNAILAYREETQYFEDVVLLTAMGTAVSVDRSWKNMHLGPEGMQNLVTRKFRNNRMCRLLHCAPDPTGAELEGPRCERCHRKVVPELLLMSCELPNEMIVDEWPRLIEVRAVKSKPDNRGVDLAYTISQAIPYLEYTIHRQLMFKMKIWGLNCIASLRTQIAITDHLIVATTTGTGFRLRGLPSPLQPKVEFPAPTEVVAGLLNPRSKNQKKADAQVERFRAQIEEVTASAEAHRQRMEAAEKDPQQEVGGGSKDAASSPPKAGSPDISSVPSPDSTGNARGGEKTKEFLENSGNGTANINNEGFPLDGVQQQQQQQDDVKSNTSAEKEKSPSSSDSDATSSISSLSSGSSSSSDDAYDRREFLLQIDDAEEAEAMSGMFDGPTNADSVLFSSPYFHGDPNLVEFSQHVTLQRKYDMRQLQESGLSSTEFISAKCVGDAKRAMLFKLWQFSRRKKRRCVVLSYRSEILFMTDDNHVHVRLSGMFSCLREEADTSILQLQALSRFETERICEDISSSSTDTDDDEENELDTLAPELHFTTATAPFCLPYVGRGYAEDSDSSSDGSDSERSTVVGGGGEGSTREGTLISNGGSSIGMVHHASSAATLGGNSSVLAGGTAMEFTRENSTLQPHSIFGLSTPLSSATAIPKFPIATAASSPGSPPASVGAILGEPGSQALVSTAGSSGSGSKSRQQQQQQRANIVIQTLAVDLATLLKSSLDAPPIHLTPLDFVPGGVVVKYIGRLSLHFIREVPVKEQEENVRGLGTFFASTLLDVNHVAISLAVGMGGTAVLDFKITFHEMEDHEKWGYLFISISGHVVEHVVPSIVAPLPPPPSRLESNATF